MADKASEFLIPTVPEEHKGPAKKEPADGSELIGLSLSGGGNRAALFGMGAVLALTDSGTHRRVSTVSSVSGGSMLNACLGSQVNWRQADSEEVRRALLPLVDVITATGFTVPGFISWLVSLALLMAVGGVLWSLFMSVIFRSFEFFVLGAVLFGGLNLIAYLFWLLHAGRQGIALGPFNNMLLGTSARLSDIAGDRMEHVVCATDLETATHFYFTGDGVKSDEWGLGAPEDIPLSFAVESSAAFPLVFPVKKLATRRLSLDPARKPPRALKLVDGGVHDNLGLPWVIERLESNEAGSLDRIIAVNSSWDIPYRRLGRLKTPRIFSVMHQSNWSYRARTAERDFLRDLPTEGRATGALVSIGESPYDLLERLEALVRGKRSAAAQRVRHRIEGARAFLEESGCQRSALELLCRRAAEVRTTLGRIPKESARGILEHGYLSTAVASHVLLATALPPLSPDLTMRHIVDRQLSGKRYSYYSPMQWFRWYRGGPKAQP